MKGDVDFLVHYKKVDDVIKELYFCDTKEDAEKIFEKSGIKSFKDRIFILQKCMGIEKVFNSSDATEEEYYRSDLSAFEDGTWRLV